MSTDDLAIVMIKVGYNNHETKNSSHVCKSMTTYLTAKMVSTEYKKVGPVGGLL